MRKLMMAAATIGAISGAIGGAQAADMPDLPFLRGGFSDAPARVGPIWQGYYVGGQYAYGSSDEKFTGSNAALTSGILANTLIDSQMGVSQWPLSYKNQSGHVSAFGGFVGYNSQWEDVVIGVEANYLRGKFGGESSGSMSRYNLLTDNNYHSVTSTATSSINITDVGTFRARAGYAFGSFLPYMFGGFALGHADLVRSASVQDFVIAGTGSTTPAVLLGSQTFPTVTEGQYGRLIYGYTAGVGVDVNLIGGLFLRAEYEYIRFTSSVDTQINTVRAGVGYKF